MRCIPIFIVQLCFYEAVLSAIQFGFISARAGHFIGLNPFFLWIIIATPLNTQRVLSLPGSCFALGRNGVVNARGAGRPHREHLYPCVAMCFKYNPRINIFPSALLQHVHMPAVCSLFCPTCLLLGLE